MKQSDCLGKRPFQRLWFNKAKSTGRPLIKEFEELKASCLRDGSDG